jgi:2-polyprenyl-3-methyl-5-hydroxy-6-metoxy-1,4-benzoquinol methylase
MDKQLLHAAAQECIEMIKNIDFSTLGISEYNYQYIERLLPNLDYYFRIYSQSVELLLMNRTPGGYVVDFGGGHGFLSLYLKQLGFQVIYCDSNPLSVKTIQRILDAMGFGPDIIIEGSSAELLDYCRQHQLSVDYLIATDLIEHVYDLNLFFAHLKRVNPSLQMIFTTGSNPCNAYKVRHLRKMMVAVETSFFLPMRTEFIQNQYSELTSEITHQLALLTRGRMYDDVTKAVEEYISNGTLPNEIERFNTCDPQSGNWVERILPLSEYRKLAENNGFRVAFVAGFYNVDRRNFLLRYAMIIVNCLIRYSGRWGRLLAPYLILKMA